MIFLCHPELVEGSLPFLRFLHSLRSVGMTGKKAVGNNDKKKWQLVGMTGKNVRLNEVCHSERSETEPKACPERSKAESKESLPFLDCRVLSHSVRSPRNDLERCGRHPHDHSSSRGGSCPTWRSIFMPYFIPVQAGLCQEW